MIGRYGAGTRFDKAYPAGNRKLEREGRPIFYPLAREGVKNQEVAVANATIADV